MNVIQNISFSNYIIVQLCTSLAFSLNKHLLIENSQQQQNLTM